MKAKSTFEPCKVSLTIFDGRNVLATSGAHDAPEAWFDDDSNGIIGGNGQ